MKIIKQLAIIFLAVIIWAVFIGYGVSDGFILKPFTKKNTSEAFIDATKQKLENEFVGNFAITLIENGEISNSYFYSTGESVSENSLFPVASISKWVTSFGVLKLVEEGKLDLDTPVDNYLSRWHLPTSEFDNNKVTIRNLLSHSSGLIDDLGYEGFTATQTIQTIEESLIKASDSPYSEGVAVVGYEPGSEYMYSGAGYTIIQLLIEEVTGQSFQDYMTEAVFEPLKMANSTFDLSKKPNQNLAQVFQADGKPRQMNKFTALAAASLYTSSADLSKFLLANISVNAVLSEKTITEMATAETFINEIAVYGLGPHLYSQNDKNSNIIGHDGSGNNAINTAARIDLMSKDGIIVLETGNYNIASAIADEWIFCKAGIADYVVIMRNKNYLIKLFIGGVLVILALAFFFIRRKNSRSR